MDLVRCPCGTSGPNSRWPLSGGAPWAAGRVSLGPAEASPLLQPLTETGLWHHTGERASPGGPEGCQAVPGGCSLDHSWWGLREGPRCSLLCTGCRRQDHTPHATRHTSENPEQQWAIAHRGLVLGAGEGPVLCLLPAFAHLSGLWSWKVKCPVISMSCRHGVSPC